MAAIKAAVGVASLLAFQFRILVVSAECLDMDSEEFRNMNARIDLLTWRIQDFVAYQTKFRNLERKVLLREQISKNFDRRLRTAEGQLEGVKVELERHQRPATTFTSGAAIRERAEGSQEDLGVEEWLLRERVERQTQEAKLQISVQSLMQMDEEVLKQLNTTTENVQKIGTKVSDLEVENMHLEQELDGVRKLLELFSNTSEERKGPPLSAEQSRTKLNEFLRDVEELNLFEAAANHSHLMTAVGQLSQGLGKLTNITESVMEELGTLSSNYNDMLTKVSVLRQETDTIRGVVEQDKPWEGFTNQEMELLEEKMKSEIQNLEKSTEVVCKGETVALKEEIGNLSFSLQQLRSEFEASESLNKQQQNFRMNFMQHLDQTTSEKDVSVSKPEQIVTFGIGPKPLDSAGNRNEQTSKKSSAVANIRKLSDST